MKTSTLTLTALVAIAFFYKFLVADSTLVQNSEGVERSNGSVEKTTTIAPSAVPGACAQDNKPAAGVTVKDVLVSDQILDDAQNESFKNPSAVLAKAKAGDAKAARAMFDMVSSCYPVGAKPDQGGKYPPRPGCPDVPAHVVEDRFSLLEASALMGDVAVQTVYLLNALPVADLLAKGASDSYVLKAKLLRENAEKFGVAASNSGGREATHALARAYAIGSFGSRDPESAYFHLLPLQLSDPSLALNEQLKVLEKQLSQQQKRAAQVRAFGCVSTDSSLISANPFN